MWRKLICRVVLVVFLGVQLAQSLRCYTCNGPESCQSSSIKECNNATANETSRWLSSIHSDVLITAGNNSFKCMNLTYFYYANNSKMSETLGCFHQGIPVCSLTLNATNSDRWAKGCKTCGSDLCNRNPAGTFSKSTYTMIASVLVLIFAKLRA